eukprot:403350104
MEESKESQKQQTSKKSNKKRTYDDYSKQPSEVPMKRNDLSQMKSHNNQKQPTKNDNSPIENTQKSTNKRLKKNTEAQQQSVQKIIDDSNENPDDQKSQLQPPKKNLGERNHESSKKVIESSQVRSTRKSSAKIQESQQKPRGRSTSKQPEKKNNKAKTNSKKPKNRRSQSKRNNFDEDDDEFSVSEDESEFEVSNKNAGSSEESLSSKLSEEDSFDGESEDFDDVVSLQSNKKRGQKGKKGSKPSRPSKGYSQSGSKSVNKEANKNKNSQEEEKVYDKMGSNNNEATSDIEEQKQGLSTPQRRMLDFIESEKDGPWFTWKEYIRDLEGRRPDEEDYDPSTLFIPDQDLKNMTPGMQKYWEIKSKNFDKIVFYRWGEWFILYYQDSVICSKILDLVIPPRQYQKMIGFYNSQLKENIEKLVNHGYKVAVAEQTETGKQLAKRVSMIKDEGGSTGDNDFKVVRREVAQIYSKGTFYNLDDGGVDYDTKYVLSYIQDQQNNRFGFCYFDTSTLKFFIGQFDDDFTLKQFRTLCLQIRPVETIVPSNVGDKNESVMILKNSPMPPSISYLSMQELHDDEVIVQKLEKYFGQVHEDWPDTIKNLIFNQEKRNPLAIQAFGLSVIYLEQLLQAETIIPVADFYTQDEHKQELMQSGNMVIDAQAIEHLELLEIPGRSKNHGEGSFFSFLSKGCATSFGKRLLKRWVVGPLKDAVKINQRLDSVSDLVREQVVRDKLQAKFKKIPDIERLLSKIYTYSAKSTVKAIYIDIAVLNRLDEFYSLLELISQLIEIIEDVFDKDVIKGLKSTRLRALVQFQTEEKKKQKIQQRKRKNSKAAQSEDEGTQGKNEQEEQSIFPDYRPILKEFEDMITWKTIGKKKIPEPIQGLDEEFDRANDKVERVKEKIEKHIEVVRKELKSSSINYSTGSMRFRYEIEVPEELTKKVPDHYTQTSTAKGRRRYQSDDLREMILQLEDAEEQFKDALVPFLREMFKKFYAHRQTFTRAVQCAAELDCLCALAIISSNEDQGPMTRPEIITDNDDMPYIELRQMRHPCVEEQMAKSSLLSYQAPKRFIPNDCVMGTLKNSEEKHPNILLITGPNMGGKSTLLRQTCLASIMAQIGCYVPASLCRLTIVDRVFTRIGASDRILENKSTFFVELEETKTIVEQATQNSLVIMDELGRGTSTFDGYSIAHSVLSYIANTIKCRTLFTTHYHMLVDDFVHMQDRVGLYHMKSSFEEKENKVEFKYKFMPGVAPQSYGIYVAKLAGINERVLELAKVKSDLFNTKIDQLTKKVREIRQK